MTRETTQFKSSIRGTLGAGLAAMAGNSGRTYCILQHQTNSRRYSIGQQQEIIVDYAEIGRGRNCVIRFGEDMRMVSAVHAAILKQQDQWFIVNKSRTNQTLVNGRPVNDRWFLKNGDVIQFASDGPRLGFILPQNALVSSIGFTRRMELFREQALRPYRRALMALTLVMLLVVSILSWKIRTTSEAVAETKREFELTKQQYEDAQNISRAEAEVNRRRMDSLMNSNRDMRDRIRNLVRDLEGRFELPQVAGQGSPTMRPASNDLTSIHGSIFFIQGVKLKIRWNEIREEISFPVSGTGFLLNDGRFITARHVIMPWNFISDPDNEEELFLLNVAATSGGTVTATYRAYSSNGQTLEFNSDQFRTNSSTDEIVQIERDDRIFNLTKSSFSQDWAVIQVSSRGALALNPQASTNLPVNQPLDILGFPLGFGVSADGITPQQSRVTTTQAGLNNGLIFVNGAMDHGSSGGPALIYDGQGNPQVVGIAVAGAGSAMRFLLPVATIR